MVTGSRPVRIRVPLTTVLEYVADGSDAFEIS